MQPFDSDFFHLAKYIWDSSVLLHESANCYFLLMNNNPFYVYSIICLSIPQLRDMFPIFGMYRFFCERRFAFYLSK